MEVKSDAVKKNWGEAFAFLKRTQKAGWADLLVILGLSGIFFAVLNTAQLWTGQPRAAVEISLKPIALFRYTFYSLMRGLIAYGFSLLFTLGYGYWAAKDRLAQKILIPLLDILQSIPVLGFMPGLVLALTVFFPHSNIGLELAAVVMIFTGQAWNMTFSFYQSLRSMPSDLGEAATVYHFSAWERFRWTELPASTVGLVWNSMMSMAGGWFFLMINESFVLGDKDFRLPGIGSYMSVAASHGDMPAMIWAVTAMVLMIIFLDQFLWRPVVVWAQKFRVEESGGQDNMSSWFLNFLSRSEILQGLKEFLRDRKNNRAPAAEGRFISFFRNIFPKKKIPSTVRAPALRVGIFLVLLTALALGAFQLVFIIRGVSLTEWRIIFEATFWTLSRVLASTALGTLWALPAGLAIGLSPRLSRILQPVVQVAASFPAPMLFPAVIALLGAMGVPINWGSILLMLLGTQWYILFNVIAGAMAIPADLKEAAFSYRLPLASRFFRVYLPSVFPFLVTGWVTAAGGAWNASIVSEYVRYKGVTLTAHGVGALISAAAEKAQFPVLAASVIVMSTVVILFNRTVWRSCYQLAERRYSLTK